MTRFPLRTYAPLLVTFVIMALPLFAAANSHILPNGSTGVAPNGSTGIAPNGSTGVAPGSFGKLDNPLAATNFCVLIKTILDAVLIIGMPIAVLFLVWVGFSFILAQGNPEKLKDAQKNFLNTVIGIAIFLGAWAIAKIIAATLQGLGVSAVNECVR